MARRTSSGGRFYYVLNFFMVLTYAFGGIALLFWHMPGLPDTNRKIIAGVLLLYSLYRGVSLFRRYKQQNNDA